MKILPFVAIAPVALAIIACEAGEAPATLEAVYRYDDLVRFHSTQHELCRSGDRGACTAVHMIRETLREGGICYGPEHMRGRVAPPNTFHRCNDTDRALESQQEYQLSLLRNSSGQDDISPVAEEDRTSPH